MKRTEFGEMGCSIARALDWIGEWWTPLIVRDVFYGLRRFEALQAHLGISRNILTDRLSTLVEGGILQRRLYQEKPERYEYRLTEKGIDLYPILLAMMEWGDRWAAPEGGPPVALVHEGCGRRTRPRYVCDKCGEEITARNVRPKILSEKLAGDLERMRSRLAPALQTGRIGNGESKRRKSADSESGEKEKPVRGRRRRGGSV